MRSLCANERGTTCSYDPFAVAVIKVDNVVDHVPRLFSAACYVFLGRPRSRILCTVVARAYLLLYTSNQLA